MGRGIWPPAVPAESTASSPNPSPSPSHQSYNNNNNNNNRRETTFSGGSSRSVQPESSEFRTSNHGSHGSHGENRTGRSTEGSRDRNRMVSTTEVQGARRNEGASRSTVEERQRMNPRSLGSSAQPNSRYVNSSILSFVPPVTGNSNESKPENGISGLRGHQEGESAGNGRQGASIQNRRMLREILPGGTWWRDAYQVDWRPKRFIAKFRQQTEFFRFAANCEFSRTIKDVKSDRIQQVPSLSVCGFEVGSANFKFVLKPTHAQHEWKFLYEPFRQDIRFLSGKVPLSSFLTFQVEIGWSTELVLQVGIGHDFSNQSTKLRWKIDSAWGGPSAPTSLAVRKKTTLPICPGLDVRTGWSAEYSLPHLHGSVGMGDPVVGLNVGRISASVDRIETIFTNMY